MAYFITCLISKGTNPPLLGFVFIMQIYKIMFKKLKEKWQNLKNWFNEDHHYEIEIELGPEFLFFLIIVIIGIIYILL